MNDEATTPAAKPGTRPGHDPAEINLKVVVIFVGIVVVMVALVLGGIKKGLGHFEKVAEQADRAQSAINVLPAIAASRAYFPRPREQVSPRADLEAFRAREEAELNSYGWIDRKSGVVRLPIARAMELMSRRTAFDSNYASGTHEATSMLNLQQRRPGPPLNNVEENAK